MSVEREQLLDELAMIYMRLALRDWLTGEQEKTPEPGKAAGVEWELNDGCPGEHNSAAG